jgi:PTS system cellobiose-specific IIA component
MEEKIFEIILHCGDARGYAFDALKLAREGRFDEAADSIKKSEEELRLSHKTQTELIQSEINGGKVEMSLLMVHAQDQLMTAISEQNLIVQMIEMCKEIKELKK